MVETTECRSPITIMIRMFQAVMEQLPSERHDEISSSKLSTVFKHVKIIDILCSTKL